MRGTIIVRFADDIVAGFEHEAPVVLTDCEGLPLHIFPGYPAGMMFFSVSNVAIGFSRIGPLFARE